MLQLKSWAFGKQAQSKDKLAADLHGNVHSNIYGLSAKILHLRTSKLKRTRNDNILRKTLTVMRPGIGRAQGRHI